MPAIRLTVLRSRDGGEHFHKGSTASIIPTDYNFRSGRLSGGRLANSRTSRTVPTKFGLAHPDLANINNDDLAHVFSSVFCFALHAFKPADRKLVLIMYAPGGGLVNYPANSPQNRPQHHPSVLSRLPRAEMRQTSADISKDTSASRVVPSRQSGAPQFRTQLKFTGSGWRPLKFVDRKL
ncbi:putative 5-deoxy-glucuronate isomerase [Anopheles sinensis]|uniref:Putative 5-deoxy-glucuronate isomerase n=1 Tax=Anopheles sinensis TaxID=74873 RepID=A0A084W0S2_ANOSI|nr:putative 5-deoxy-glucuronate isomerase [Anopheles sinensis]